MRCECCGKKIPKEIGIYYRGKRVCSTRCFNRLKNGNKTDVMKWLNI